MDGLGRIVRWGGLAALLIATAAIGVRELVRQADAQFTLLEGTRPYAFTGTFLSEDEAMEMGDYAMRLAGMTASDWQPQPIVSSQHAPDGIADKFFARDTLDPNQGSILYTSVVGHREIYFNIRRDGQIYRYVLNRGK